MFRREKYTGVVVAILVILGTFFSGLYIGYAQKPAADLVTGVSHKEDGKPDAVDFSEFWQAWQLLSDRYVAKNGNVATSSEKVVTDKDKVYGAIAGLAKSLGDPYTVFFPPKELELFESSIRGNFEGVGMEISKKDDILTVVAPLKDSPAEKAGVKPGDKIIKINGDLATEFSVEEAVQKIRGPKGTAVALTLAREKVDKPIEVSITRAVINLPTIQIDQKLPKLSADGKVQSAAKDADLTDGVFVVRLYTFSQDSIDQFANAISRLSKSNAQKMIIDLRGNPGGYLEAAVDIASWFIPRAQPVLIEKGSKPETNLTYASKGYELPLNVKKVKIAVLVDKGSASASEILSGALKEYGRATLVGEKTFGKGSVQELVNLPEGALKVTIARWYTPKGVSISQTGIEPDVKIETTPENTKDGKDPVLAKAIEILNK